MPPIDTLLTFMAATLLLLAVPGPAVMYIVTQSVTHGRQAGLVSVAGVHAGSAVHVGAAIVGLSTLIMASATVFTAIKLSGAAYLVWLGVRSIRNWRRQLPEMLAPQKHDDRGLGRVFLDGAIVNVLNPKTAVFFLAFVPQFVDPTATRPALTLAALGGTFVVLGLLSDSAYAVAAGWVGARLERSSRVRRPHELVAGLTYLGLGVATAMSGGRSAKG